MSKTHRRNGDSKSHEGIGYKLAHKFWKQVRIIDARRVISDLPIQCAIPLGRMFGSKVPTFRPRASKPPSREPTADL